MTYKIKENAKNVWIRNNENTQDLSPLTDANSVYFNNGRTLEQELGKGAMESNVVTVNSSMEKVIDEAYDGTYESLVFKGKSLVNIIDYNKRDFNEGNTFDSGVVTINHRGGSYSNSFFLTPDNIKPSTDYFVIFNVISNTYENYIKLMSDDDKACCFDYNLTIQAKTTGLYKMKVTSKSDLSPCRYLLRTFGSNNTNSGSCQYRAMVIEYQEGMENWGIPYFEGLCDSKMPILRNVGKNLLDPQTFIPLDKGVEYVRYEDGYVLANFTNANTHFFYEVDLARLPKGMYTVIAKQEGERSYLGIQHTFKDGTKTWGKTQFNNDGSYAKLGLYMQSTTNDPSLKVKAKIMLVANGDTTSPYEDYKTNILRTSEEVVLREVNGVQDTYNALTGEYVKRIGECVLDGSQALSLDGSLVYLGLTDKPINNFGIADKMPVITVNQLVTGEFGICMQDRGASGRIYINIEGLTTREEILQHLRTNPITIHYGLVESVTTVVEPSTIPFIYQNGHIILESGYKGQSLTPILEYTASVSRTGQVENVAKTIQRHETQLTLLEKMLIGNIIELDYNNTLMALNLKMDEVK